MSEENINRSHVVSGLAALHAEMAGRIEHHQKEIRRIGADLVHVTATLKLLAPAADLRAIRAKPHRERSILFRPGEAPRAVLDVLRQADDPLTSRAIVERIFAVRGIDLVPERIEAVQKSVLTVLKSLEAKKLVRVAATGKAGIRSWAIA